MKIDVEKMAQELGLRPDQLRLQLGILTHLQREIRQAETFEEIVSLASRFEDRYSSCGPTFEKEEKEEYQQRRVEFFATYLEQFTTFGSFEEIHPLLTTQEEGEVTERFCGLLEEEVREAGESIEKLHSLEQLIPERGRLVSQAKDVLKGAIQQTALKKLKEAKSLAEVISIFASLEKAMEYSYSFGHGKDWDFDWQLVQQFEDIFLIKEKVSSQFINPQSFKERFSSLLEDRFASVSTFDETVKIVQGLADRDSENRYDPLYTQALEQAASQVRNKEQAKHWLRLWRNRDKVCNRVSNPKMPDAFISKWDELYFQDTQNEQDPWELKKLNDKSPYGTKTRQVAVERIKEILEPKISALQTLEELEEFEKETSLSVYSFEVGGVVREKRAELERKRAIETVTSSDDKRIIIGAFHELKESDPEIAHQALLKLAQHFPAEELDVVPELETAP